jgi:hypothetical protein
MIRELGQVFDSWKAFYGDSTVLSTTVASAHVVALLGGGGLAIAADRTTLRILSCPDPARPWLLEELHDVHRPIVIGMAVIVISGLLMLAADLDTYLVSVAFWIKMGFLLLLTANGLFLYRSEARLAQAARGGQVPDSRFCSHLRLSARISIALWILITVVGMILVAAA